MKNLMTSHYPNTPIWRICLLSLLLAVALGAQDRDLQVAGSLRSPIPQNLRGLHLANPYAAILVEVNEKGEIIDLMPIDATHVGLVEKALEVIQKATFLPSIVEGEPQGSRTKVYVNFFDIEQQAWRNGGGFLPQGGSVSDALDRRIYEVSEDSYLYRESKPSELDQPLRIVKTKLRVYTSEEGVPQHGSCVVEYFVGPEGRVHFPRILTSDHDDLGMSALLTLKVTEFEPPLRNGNPTYVRVRQPFNFSPQKTEAVN